MHQNHGYPGPQYPHPQQPQTYGQHPHGYGQHQQNPGYQSSSPPNHHYGPVPHHLNQQSRGPAVNHQFEQQASPPENSCYNCGKPDHWAQDCPEPRRSVPAGSLTRVNASQPFKRHKPNGPGYNPSGTHYAGPPPQPPQYGYGPPSGPPTPVAGSPHGYQQWPPQGYNQPYPQQPPYGSNQYGPYPPGGPQAPTSPYGQPYPGPPNQYGWTPPLPQQHSPNQYYPSPQQQGNPYPQPRFDNQRRPPRKYPPHGPPPQSPYPHHPGPYGPNRQFSQSSSQHSPINPESPAWDTRRSSMDFHAPQPHLPDEDEDPGEYWDLLDWPDEEHVPPEPAHRPLPATSPADETHGESFFSPKPEGEPFSKYVNEANLESFCLSIHQTEESDHNPEDPAFSEISATCDMIPVAELISQRESLLSGGFDQSSPGPGMDSVEDDARDEYDGGRDREERGESGWNVMDNLENVLESARPPKSQGRATDDNMVSESTEQRLKRLGVTGTAKPASPRTRASRGIQQAWKSSASQSPEYETRRSSRSSQDGTLDGHYRYREQPALYSRHPSLQTGSLNGGGGASSAVNERFGFANDENRRCSYNEKYPHPGPPLHTKRSHQQMTGSPSDSHNGTPLRAHDRHANGNHGKTQASNGKTSISRSLSYDGERETLHREEDDDASNEPKRQADEDTPKRKKSQPQVAEAYSRRW